MILTSNLHLFVPFPQQHRGRMGAHLPLNQKKLCQLALVAINTNKSAGPSLSRVLQNSPEPLRVSLLQGEILKPSETMV